MKEIILQLANYNVWANNLLFSTISQLTPVQQQAEVSSSFPNVYRTLLHMLDAESIWWQRVKLQEKIDRPSDSFSGDTPDILAQLKLFDKQWLDWITNATEAGLQHEYIYYTTSKERFKQPIYHTLLQVFNHNTYHRGQLVTMLRQLQIEKIPQTDFVAWSRKK